MTYGEAFQRSKTKYLDKKDKLDIYYESEKKEKR